MSTTAVFLPWVSYGLAGVPASQSIAAWICLDSPFLSGSRKSAGDCGVLGYVLFTKVNILMILGVVTQTTPGRRSTAGYRLNSHASIWAQTQHQCRKTDAAETNNCQHVQTSSRTVAFKRRRLLSVRLFAPANNVLQCSWHA